MRADQATNGLAIGEEDQGGHALDAHLHGRLQVLVGIHAGETQQALVGLTQFLEDGASTRQGGHQEAVKSTITGSDECLTCSAKSWSVTVKTGAFPSIVCIRSFL